ncbi:CAP domain-containing protein [Mesobacillus foraminis]|uniref:CAP domain-containing protein n=1 Tax=Mesobacillus foraminis TaxID=279826 RepID=UPI00214C1393|nr:CAP domain-containing protein [Mesobacillus foraminis]
MRFILLLIAGFLLYTAWPVIEHKLGLEDKPVLNKMKSEMDSLKEHPEFLGLTEEISRLKNLFTQTLESVPKDLQPEQPIKIEKPDLKTPTDQSFSIANIELGETKTEVEEQLGSAKRSTHNEYGTEWHTYHDHYHNFLMVAFNQDNKVAGIYSNQDLIKAKNGITYGTPKEHVLDKMGEPLEKIQKGLVYYQLPKERDYDIFLLDGSYTTIFYDKHKNNSVTAIQVVSTTLENERQQFYTEASNALISGFEYQLFDLTNAARVQHGLQSLAWDEAVRETARSHSLDMAENNYFNHTNLEGQSPFDRMAEDGISFSVAGENLAYGQTSSVFAHEGLMNSKGHRENILKEDFKLLGVGVAFNSKSQPYYTENFYTKRF